MSKPADLRLERLLGGDQLASLRRRLRRRFERAMPGEPVEHVRIAGLDAQEHAALASLIGRPQRFSSSLGIDVRMIDASLQRAGVADSLRDALERLDGPIANLAALRVRHQAQWAEVIAECRHPGLAELLTPACVGLLKRLARQDPAAAGRLCQQAEAVLRRLPAKGQARSQLAAETLGDAHALDDGQPVATLVLAVQRRAVAPMDEADAATTGEGAAAERARDIWAAAGVLVNELARPALFLNLATEDGDGRTRGEPSFISLRALVRTSRRWMVGGRDVHVCENPNLVAIAADRLGARCRPLVCTDGMPGAAQRTLLTQLARAGARLFYHGDFDWPGITIANTVLRDHGALPWRLGAADYLAAIGTPQAHQGSLHGTPVAAAWDESLTTAMERHQISIAEESVTDSLLDDLDEQ
ncbi:TIGR02679 family protein [Reyranella sp.]|uniref:TIGR02679 family protein n=1 Tax=Reyranella sp. TaxID=1929291 RepID=UPI003D0D755F